MGFSEKPILSIFRAKKWTNQRKVVCDPGKRGWEAVSELVGTCALTKDLFVSGKRLKNHKMKEDGGGILTFFTHHPSCYTSAICPLCRAISFDQFIHSLTLASPTSCIIFANLAKLSALKMEAVPVIQTAHHHPRMLRLSKF